MTARDALAGIIQDHVCRDLPCQIRLPPGAEAYALADRLTAAGLHHNFRRRKLMVTILPERLAQLDTITLDKGAHTDFSNGHCAMEVVSFLAGEGFTAAPECASPVLTSFTVSVNDQWDSVQRQKLVPFLPRMVGTRGDGQDEARALLALDWLVRTYAPAFLDLAGLSVEAEALRGLRRIVDVASAEAAVPVVRVGRDKASAARDAFRAAARAAAGDAARAAARDAASDAAWAAARAAARDKLAPTVEVLQASALDLLDRMIDPSNVTAPTTFEGENNE